MSDPTKQIIDQDRIGKKGFPRHWQALGIDPPMKYDSGDPVPTVPEEPTIADLEAYARDLSWRTRVAGTTINGVVIRCDDGAVALITAMHGLATADPARTFSFDTGSGTLTLSAADAISLAVAVGEWVQKTFDRRADVLAAITSEAITNKAHIDTAFIDVTDEWAV